MTFTMTHVTDSAGPSMSVPGADLVLMPHVEPASGPARNAAAAAADVIRRADQVNAQPRAGDDDDLQRLIRSLVMWALAITRMASSGPEAKRADAADNLQQVKPFAVVSDSLASNDAYLEAMAKRGVLNFGSFVGRSLEFFNAYPKLIWGYAPPLELQAEAYASYVCNNLTPHNVSFSGPEVIGRPRKYGLVFTTDPRHPELRDVKNLIIDKTDD